jgi:Family of unknown function (DUF6496)
MPVGPTKTKAQKRAVVGQEMHAFKHGKLHSGSKHGPVVTSRPQAIAIAMHEANIKPKGNPMPMKSQPKPKEGAGHARQPKSSRGAVKTGVAAPHRVAVPELMAHGEGHSEGKNTQPVAGHQASTPNFGLAEHHRVEYDAGRQAHQYRPPQAQNAHGYGHSVAHRSGQLRLSGKEGAHRVGHRGK